MPQLHTISGPNFAQICFLPDHTPKTYTVTLLTNQNHKKVSLWKIDKAEVRYYNPKIQSLKNLHV